jgi:hypothetical protein
MSHLERYYEDMMRRNGRLCWLCACSKHAGRVQMWCEYLMIWVMRDRPACRYYRRRPVITDPYDRRSA